MRVSHEMFGLEYIVFRPHNVYGERQNIGDRYRNVVGIFMNQLLRGEPMTIFGDGEQERAFTHIDDVAPTIARSVEYSGARNQVFNVGADLPHTVNELARIVADAMGVRCEVVHLAARNEVKIAYSDHAKAERVFGKHEIKTLEEGVGAMAAWVGSMAQGRATSSAGSRSKGICLHPGQRSRDRKPDEKPFLSL